MLSFELEFVFELLIAGMLDSCLLEFWDGKLKFDLEYLFVNASDFCSVESQNDELLFDYGNRLRLRILTKCWSKL